MKLILALTLILLTMTACATPPASGQPTAITNTPQINLPNPASTFCVEQGFKSEIRTAADRSQSGVCIFPNGEECDEWAYYRGECGVADQNGSPSFPTAMAIDSAEYQGWWKYTHTIYNFSIMLPEDWIVEEVTTNDPIMNGHTLSLHPKEVAPDVTSAKESIRMTFRRISENVPLWPTGVGQGEFISHGTFDVAGQPAERVLLVCPTGEVASIWYHQAEGKPNITSGDLEFGFIFSAASSHCETGYSLSGKTQLVGEMIIASLQTP